MKRCRLFSALALAASLLVFNTSCEIGLGASVDIAAPTVSITYPEQSSVIRDTFVIAGDCDDDKSVAKVKITILRTDTGKSQTAKEFEVPADNAKGKWRAEINEWLGEGKGYNGWELCDGKYVANVVAIDNTNRPSGVASLSFDIDNTAPIFILKNPTSENISSPSKFGTTFKVAGTMSDDHTVSTMTIKIYDKDADFSDPENPPVPLETVVENNIDTTAEVVIANYSRAGELKDRYDHMYAGVEKEGDDKVLLCTIEVQDNAKEFKNPSEAENTSAGNTTSNFYITDKVNNIWTSGDMDPGRVKKVVNGTATNVSEELASQVLNLYNNAISTTAAFSINSDSNPTYEVSSYGILKDAPVTKLATTSASVTFNLTYGRNQENIKPETLKVFLWGPYEENQVTEEMRAKMYSTNFDTLFAYYEDQKAEHKARVIAYNGEGTWEGKTYKKNGVVYDKGYDEGSKDYLIQSIELEDTINPNKYYYISAYAEDLMGAAATPKSYFFAFKGQSSGAAPEVFWTDTSYGTNCVENQGIVGSGELNFYGYAKYSDGIDTKSAISYKAERTDVTGVPNITGNVEEVGTDPDENNIYWKITLPGVPDNTEAIENWKITVNATSTDASGVIGEAKRTFQIDTQKPKVILTSLKPYVRDSEAGNLYLNGKIAVEGRIDEKNPSKIWYEIWSNGVKTYPTSSTPESEYTYDETSRNINVNIDTTDTKYALTDESELKIIFYAEDKAGNIGTNETKVLNGGKDFILKQSTDKPSIVAGFVYDEAGKTKENIKADAWYDAVGKLNIALTDDDGVSDVTVYIDGVEQTGESAPSFNKDSTNTSINYPVPTVDGVHSIKVVVKDKTYGETTNASIKNLRTETFGPYTFGVDTSVPSVTDDFSKGLNYNKKGQAVTLKGTADDKNGIKDIEVAITVEGSATPVKTYKLSAENAADKVTYNTLTKVWSVTIPEGTIADGTYTVTTTGIDYAGKTFPANSRWLIDTKTPAVTAKVTTAKKTVNAETWYDTKAIAVEVTATDDFAGVAGSGIKEVVYSLNGTDWYPLTQDRVDNTKFTRTVTCEDGTNKIYIKAKDKLDYEKAIDGNFLTVKVDSEAPDVFEFVSLDGQADSSKLINGNADIPLVVKVSDALTGVASVKIIQIGENEKTLVAGTPSEDKYTIDIPKADLKVGDIIVEVEDKVGHKDHKKVATLNIDNTAPVITINSVSPIANSHYLNGTVKIEGKITETNLENVWYEVYSNGSKVTYAADQTLAANTDIDFDIDTTKAVIKDDASFDVIIHAEDKAKNSATPVSIKVRNGNALFTVKQSTDKPLITPNNFTFVDAKTNTKENLTSWFSGTPLIGTVSDDDTISSVSIVTKNEAGTSVVTAAAEQTIPTFTYALPSSDGVYQVTVTAKDSTWTAGATDAIKANRMTTYGPFLIGVDSKAPELTENSPAGVSYSNGAIALTGTASDANGIKEITVEAFKDNAATAAKTYKLSGSKVTYNASTKAWSCTFADADLTDGSYKFKVTATDYAGKDSIAYCNWIKDKVAPSVTPSVVTAVTKTVGSTKWYKTASLEIKAVVTDATSGVANVQYSLDGSEWFNLKQGTTEATKNDWTATVKASQGANTIQFKATDKSGLENADKTLAVSVDTLAPETLTLVSVDDDTSFSGTKMVNGSTDVKIVVSAADSGIGLDTIANGAVVVTKIGKTTLGTPIKASSVTDGKYTITIPKANLESGAVTVTAKDLLGITTTDELFSLTVDKDKPDVSISSVSPVISKDSKKYVNGTIKISGKANDLNLERVWYTVVVNGTEGPENTLASGVDIEIDTTKYADNSTLDVYVYAIDKANNSNSAKASSVNGAGTLLFTVDQTTDIPEIAPSNITYLAAPSSGSATAASIEEAAWFTGSASNNVIGSVSDDDILTSVSIVTKNAAGTANVGTPVELIASGSTASTINFSYPLPAADGVYQVTITATDSTWADGATAAIKANRKTTYGPFVVGVDKNAPTVTESNSENPKNFVTGAIALSGTADDTNGIRDIEVKVVNAKTSAVVKTYTYSAGKVTYNSSTKAWAYTIADGDLADGKYKVTVTAKDYAGKTASVDVDYIKDKVAPSVNSASVTTPASATKVNSTDWYGTSMITVTANATDATCDVTEVSYSLNNADWSPFKQVAGTSNWTAAINCPDQGLNKIYIKAVDESNKTGYIQNDFITVYVDSKEPEACELFSIDGNTSFTNKKLVNGDTPVSFVVTAADSSTEVCTGIKEVKLTKVGTKDLSVAGTSLGSNKYEISISTANLVSGSVVVTVYDQLGKSKDFTLFTIDKDSTAPVSTVAPVNDADTDTAVIDLNKTVTIKGSASDENELADVKLYYAVGTAEPAKPTTALDKVASWTAKSWTNIASYDGSKYSWTATIDTTTLADKKNLYFYAVATDAAGNSTATPYSTTDTLYINQDSDRPKISLTNLALTEDPNAAAGISMLAEDTDTYVSTKDTDGKFWHTTSYLTGTVEDDDGNHSVKSVQWSKDGSSWSENIYDNGWRINDLEDGSVTIYFKVIDNEDGEFISAATGMNGPKIYDSNDIACLGFNGTEKEVSEILPLKVDTKAPTISTLYGYVSDSSTYNSTHETKVISAMDTLGGTNKYLYVVADTKDDNGIYNVTVKLDGTAATTTNENAKVVQQNSEKTKTVVRFDLSKLSLSADKRTENKKLEATVTDNAKKSRSTNETIIVDNKKPEITFTTREGSTLYGSIPNTITGKTTDGSLITGLYYKVTTSETKPTSGWTEVAYTGAGENNVGRENWSLGFDGSQSTPTEYHTDNFYELYKTIESKTDDYMLNLNTNLDMYIWMYAVDEVGNDNSADPVKLSLKVVPNADKPTIAITYPDGGNSVGGNIRVTGTTSIQKDSVANVYIQIDPSFDTAFDASWETELMSLATANSVADKYEVVNTGLAAPYNRGIKAKGTTGWGATINFNHEFDSKVNGEDRKVGIRAFAESTTNHRISDSAEVVATIDPNSPVFGNLAVGGKTGMRLVQYNSGSSGTIKADQSYSDGTAIRGEWYLVGSISDSSGIKKATVRMPGVTESVLLIDGGQIKKTGWVTELGVSEDGKGKNFVLNIPVGVTTPDKFGELKYDVYIQDGSAQNSDASYTYVVSYDNKAPDFAITTENRNTIVQSDGTYTLAGTLNEDADPVTGDNQSGFERIVMFVTKTTGGNTYIVDPMISNGTDGKANRVNVTALNKTDIASDGLYWRTGTVTKVENGTITVTKLNNTTVTKVTPEVRAGGLCKIDGIIYRIKYVDGTTVHLDDTTVSSSATTVYFAAGALVIDNPSVEGGNNTAVYDPSKSDSLGKDTVQTTSGDGDQMLEGTRTTGTETEWTFSIDSTQILDGTVKINFVAFDKAGNIKVESYDATVKNNAPRLAGVIYGSDLNNDGVISGKEWNRESADMYVQVLQTSSSSNERVNGKKSDGTIVDTIDISSMIKDTATDKLYRQTIKRDLTVIPQVVGGNGGLDWTMSYTDNSGKTATTAKAALSTAHSHDVIRTYGTDSEADDYKTANEENYKMSFDTLKLLQLNSNVGIDRRTGHEEQNLTFTISDKNEDAANVASAQIVLPVKILFADGVRPTGKIKPFYWRSNTDNSLYNNSKSYGHIELPSDWTNGNTDYTDSIPKVSGIITLEGEARDNVLVNQIAMKFGNGTAFTIATRGDSGWTSTNLLKLVEDDPATADVDETVTYENFFSSTNNKNWYFELVDDYTDEENYNVVKFKFHWNTRTQLPGNVVTLKNVAAQLIVTDKGSVGLNGAKTGLAYTGAAQNTVGTTNTTAANNTAYYQMDVVPYVARVYTELAALKKNNEEEWTIASRTSSGHYPVRITKQNQAGTAVTTGETISFYGFNLAGAKYGTNSLGTGTKLSTVTTGVYDVMTLASTLITTSGEVNLTVNNIPAVNNKNNNNAKGSYTGTLDNSTYGEYAYNRQSNTGNNVKLTDDLYFDVWDVMEGAARSGGRIEQPSMKVDPIHNKLGFGFIDGTFGFAMGGTPTANNDPSGQTGDNNKSYENSWATSVDFCTSAGFTYDSYGRSFGVTAGGESGDNYSDYLVLLSGMFGKSGTTYNGGNNIKIERTAQSTATITDHTNNDKQRVKSPSLAAVFHGNTSNLWWPQAQTNVYLAYYDAMNNEVRVKYGSFNNTGATANNDYQNLGSYNNTTSLNYASNRANVSVVAGDGDTSDTNVAATSENPGEYVSIAAIATNTIRDNALVIDDNLVIVWYDGKTLWYSNNSSPNGTKTNGNRGSWNTPVRVFEEDSAMEKAGEYCKVAVDANGGVHIAGYDQKNKDLCYAYLPANKNGHATSQSDFVTCVVDSYGVTGSNINIDVGKSATGTIVPHISYYSESLGRAKEAYYVGGFANNATAISAGVDDEDYFTGAWEVSVVPTRQVIEMQSNQHNDICLGLWKTDTGVIKNSTTQPNGDNNVWGNGTANPAVGYVTQVSSTKSCIEVAQKR